MMRTACLASLCAVVCACTPSVKTVTVDPGNESLGAKGAHIKLRAILKDAQGQRIMDSKLVPTWTSSAPSVASVDESGKVTALKSGDAVITAVVGQLKGEAKIAIAIPATVTLTPAALDFKAKGETATLEAKVLDDAGRPVAVKGLDWTTSDPAVARVVGGRVSAVAFGKAVITASVDVVKATAQVTVKSPEVPAFHKLVVKPKAAKLKKGRTAKLVATALDRKGKRVADVPVAWSSSNAKVATVVAGVVTAHKKGHAKITASAAGKKATVKVTVK